MNAAPPDPHLAAQLRLHLDDAQGRLDRALAVIGELHQEQQALVAELAGHVAATAPAAASPLARGLAGQRLLYVGGRPASNRVIRQLVERSGGHWHHHAGSLADRHGVLAAALQCVHRVVFPLDCIDDDALHQLKLLCIRHGLPYNPLRTSSVGSFVAALAQVDADAPLGNGAALASRFCLRQG
jgi:hypothetical protein